MVIRAVVPPVSHAAFHLSTWNWLHCCCPLYLEPAMGFIMHRSVFGCGHCCCHQAVLHVHLINCFTCAGVQEVDLMMDKEVPGQNRGFGFIGFYNYACAEAARKKLGDSEFM